ncbi:MAG: hypothetical protein ORN28_08865, partial [Rhodoferax sp.]|nr:hypothetical protein [Rhodoferax sp.]
MKHIKPIHSFTTLLTYFLPISLALALAACGGGGGDSSPPTPTETPIAPSISTQPADQPVVAPATASFSVVATGTAPLGYQWLKNGANIPGATSSSYTTPATDTGHNGVVFTVVVSNSAGQATSNAAMLTVSPPPVAPSIGTQPAAQSVIKGSTATFSVSATGTAPLRYQWKRGSTPIDGATASSYTTPATHLETDNGAIFSVVVSNNVGTVTSSPATLGVTATAVAPGIGTQPADQSVLPGATASFSVIATGTAPLRYQWKRGSTPIDGATSSSYTTPPTSLTDHDALFSVAITNTEGTVTSNTARLTVTDVAAAPTISSQPAPSQTVNEGQTASFSVIATGTAPLRYQWKKNGVDISGATSSTYTTPATVIGDNAAVF